MVITCSAKYLAYSFCCLTEERVSVAHTHLCLHVCIGCASPARRLNFREETRADGVSPALWCLNGGSVLHVSAGTGSMGTQTRRWWMLEHCCPGLKAPYHPQFHRFFLKMFWFELRLLCSLVLAQEVVRCSGTMKPIWRRITKSSLCQSNKSTPPPTSYCNTPIMHIYFSVLPLTSYLLFFYWLSLHVCSWLTSFENQNNKPTMCQVTVSVCTFLNLHDVYSMFAMPGDFLGFALIGFDLSLCLRVPTACC